MKLSVKFVCVFSLLTLPLFSQATDQQDIFVSLRNSKDQAFRNEQSIDLLEKSLNEKLTDKQKSMAHFAIGYLAAEIGLRDKAEKYLNLSLKGEDKLKPYTHYQLGKLYLKEKNYDKADKNFDLVLKLDPQRNLNYETRYALSAVALGKKHYGTAYKHLRYVERNMRSDNEYPSILLDLVRTEKARGRTWNSCKWARKLYSRHPHASVIKDWGLDLAAAKLDGKRLGCVANVSDQKRRVMWLQLTGHTDRARKEITELEEKLGKKEKYQIAQLWASYLLRDGDPKGALNQLLPFYKDKKEDFEYLMDLGKYSDRAGEYHASIGAYYKAYKDHKRHGRSRHALFQAAFLSYQFHDYDGAVQKFEEFLGAFKRSGLRRSAQWYMAWLEYLRNNNEASLKAFTDIKRQKRRARRYWRSYPNDRIDYWRAMNLVRLKRYDQAGEIFAKLNTEDLFSYYSIVSGYRLKQIEEITGKAIQLAANEERDVASDNNLVKVTGSSAEIEESEETETDLEIDSVEVAEDDEDLEVGSDEDSELASSEGAGDADQSVKLEEATDAYSNMSFKSERLQDHFDRAQELMSLGFHDWARWDLYEIERRTRDKKDLRALIHHYENMGAYHRSSYIGQIHFRNQRGKGLDQGRDLWQATFPRPYADSVSASSTEFGVAQNLIWSIMRAESFYKTDAESPVGALGLMQVMPTTGQQVAKLLGEKEFDPRSLTQAQVAIRMGSRYLKRLQGNFGQDVPLVAAAYNAGPHRVKNWLMNFGRLEMDEFVEHIPFTETRNYVKKVVTHYEIYNQLYASEKSDLKYLVQPVRAKYEGPRPLAEDWEAI